MKDCAKWTNDKFGFTGNADRSDMLRSLPLFGRHDF